MRDYTHVFELTGLKETLEDSFEPFVVEVLLEAIRTGKIENPYGDLPERNIGILLDYFFGNLNLTELANKYPTAQGTPQTAEAVRKMLNAYFRVLRLSLEYKVPEEGYKIAPARREPYFIKLAQSVEQYIAQGMTREQILTSLGINYKWEKSNIRAYRLLMSEAKSKFNIDLPELPASEP